VASSVAATQVAELVRALALGWKNLAAYPPGHPALVSSLELVHRRLTELRGPAGEVALGIANDGLLYGSDKIDSASAQKFAQALYTRGVAVLRFANQTEAHDIETFLRLLAAGTPGEQKRAIWEDLAAAGVVNINLQPVDYSAVQITDTLAEKPPEKKEESLWEKILRALIADREFSDQERELLSREVQSADELSQMIVQYVDTHAKPTFDPDATFGVRLPEQPEKPEAIHERIAQAIGRYIAEASGAKKQKSLQQAVQLLRSLPEPLRGTALRSVMQALATDEHTGPLLREFASELPHDEVLEALRYLTALGPVSSHAMMLLQSLTALQASTATEPLSPNLVGDLVSLFGEDDIDRFNPPDHVALLERAAVHMPAAPPVAASSSDQLGKRVETVANDALTRQLARTLVDLLAIVGAVRAPQAIFSRLESLFRSYLATGEFDEALDLMQRLQEIAMSTESDELRHAVHESVGHLATGETIQALIESLHSAPPEKTRAIQRLTELLGAGARRNLLLALAEESNRSRRRRLFDFIASLGPVVVPEVTSFLNDSRWYVMRNMIVLLRTVNDRTTLPEIRNLARHHDLRVRIEAIKSLFALDTNVPQALLDDLINDRDPKVAEMAIALIGNAGIKEGVRPLLQVLNGNDFFGSHRSLRLKAIRALGELADPAALPQLQRFFSDSILPWPAKEERRAAWESLSGYPSDRRADLVQKGLRSRDSQVREICQRIPQA
jgi:HEAT repeat protein